ncbi:MAG: DUF3592 domain-containing protein [Candidatus Phosphoribacter sp.]
MNDAGEVAGTIIGLVWLAIGWWMIAVGRRRGCADGDWVHVVGQIVDKDGASEGLFLRNPHIRYDAPDGSTHLVASRSRGDLWEPGQDVAILVDPTDADRAMLLTHAQRATPYVVIGWFIIVIAILTLVATAMLAFWVPATT